MGKIKFVDVEIAGVHKAAEIEATKVVNINHSLQSIKKHVSFEYYVTEASAIIKNDVEHILSMVEFRQ